MPKTVEIGQKPKQGRPADAKKALQYQPVLVLAPAPVPAPAPKRKATDDQNAKSAKSY